MHLRLDELKGFKTHRPAECGVEETHGAQSVALGTYFTQSADHLRFGQQTADDKYSSVLLEGIIRKRPTACGYILSVLDRQSFHFQS